MSEKLINNIKNYLIFGSSYGFLRGIITSYNGEIRDPNQVIIIKRPLLMTEKGCIIIFNTILSSIYSPFYIYKDLLQYESVKKGYKRPYKFENTFDYIKFI